MKRFLYILIAVSLTQTSCGFHFKNMIKTNVHAIYFAGKQPTIKKKMLSILKLNQIKEVQSPQSAEIMLEFLQEKKDKKILSLSGGAGVVREFELFYRVTFRVRKAKDELWQESKTIENRRDFSYADEEVLAKAYEEELLFESMEDDVIREIIAQTLMSN